jgi:hypothetical protein
MNLVQLEALTPNYLRHPGWRWNIALRCFSEPGLSIEQAIREGRAAGDQWLVDACRFYSQREDIVNQNPMYMTRYPAMFEAYLLHRHSAAEGGYHWLLEALLMTGASYEQIASVFNPLHGAETVEIYARVFFDIEVYRENPGNMLCTVLANAVRTPAAHVDTDFTWKVLALSQGFDAFRGFIDFLNGSRMPNQLAEELRAITEHRRLYANYHTTLTLRNAFRQEALTLASQVDQRYRIDKDKVGLSSLELPHMAAKEILGALEEAITDPGVEDNIRENQRFTEPGISSKFIPDDKLWDRMHAPGTEANNEK